LARTTDLTLLCACSAQPGELRRKWWQARLVPAFCSRFIMMNAFAPAWLPMGNRMDGNWKGLDGWGWLRCPYSARDAESYRLRLEQAHQYYAPIFAQFQISGVADLALHELLELCGREGIAVTLLLLPEGSEFRGWYPPTVRARSDTYLRQLRRQYAVATLDARAWAADDDLLDGFHLLPDGAAAFTDRLGRELLLRASAEPAPGHGRKFIDE